MINQSTSFIETDSTSCYQLLTVLIAAILFCGCQKENLSGTILNSSTSGTAADAKLKLPFPHGPNNKPDPITYYGALIIGPDPLTALDFQLNVADQLGVSCLRGTTLVPSTWSVNNLLNTSYNILLNFNSPLGDDPVPFVSDLTKYRNDLNNTLLTYTVMPVVAVIENEESNRFYYCGSVMNYINQLNVAIDVMHDHDIKVANGGITDRGLMYLVYEDFLDQGKYDSAEQFRALTGITPQSPAVQQRGSVIDTLLNAYKTMNLDYVNFHWKGNSPNMEALADVINYLVKRTGKTIFTNEIGQTDTDPNTLLAEVKLCDDRNFPYVVWYSPDESKSKIATPLQYSDGSLTPSGVSYQEYLAGL